MRRTEIMAMRTCDQTNRGGNGRERRTLACADRDAEAALMYSRGSTFAEIASALKYASKGDAQRGVNKAFAERANSQELRLAREARLAELDAARAEAWEAALHPPPAFDRLGRVVHDDDGNVVPDRQAWAAALRVILRASEVTSKLQGPNAPRRTHATIEGVLASISPADPSRESWRLEASCPYGAFPTAPRREP